MRWGPLLAPQLPLQVGRVGSQLVSGVGGWGAEALLPMPSPARKWQSPRLLPGFPGGRGVAVQQDGCACFFPPVLCHVRPPQEPPQPGTSPQSQLAEGHPPPPARPPLPTTAGCALHQALFLQEIVVPVASTAPVDEHFAGLAVFVEVPAGEGGAATARHPGSGAIFCGETEAAVSGALCACGRVRMATP